MLEIPSIFLFPDAQAEEDVLFPCFLDSVEILVLGISGDGVQVVFGVHEGLA